MFRLSAIFLFKNYLATNFFLTFKTLSFFKFLNIFITHIKQNILNSYCTKSTIEKSTNRMYHTTFCYIVLQSDDISSEIVTFKATSFLFLSIEIFTRLTQEHSYFKKWMFIADLNSDSSVFHLLLKCSATLMNCNFTFSTKYNSMLRFLIEIMFQKLKVFFKLSLLN